MIKASKWVVGLRPTNLVVSCIWTALKSLGVKAGGGCESDMSSPFLVA
jgi:hypothetical protein